MGPPSSDLFQELCEYGFLQTHISEWRCGGTQFSASRGVLFHVEHFPALPTTDTLQLRSTVFAVEKVLDCGAAVGVLFFVSGVECILSTGIIFFDTA
jgi:hypothetical protein